MKEYVVYSEMWSEAWGDENENLLLIALPISQITVGSQPYKGAPFAAHITNIGLIEFEFLTPFKGQVVYRATGLHQCDPDQLPWPLVKLVAAPRLVGPSPSR